MRQPDFRTEPFMTYWFQGFKFEFILDKVHVTNPFGDVYSIALEPYRSECPFLITLLEKSSGMQDT